MHTICDPQALSADQQALIRAAAANHGKMAIERAARTGGRAVCCGRQAFFDRQDRGVAQRYIESLHGLLELQILRSMGSHEHYELTNSGWEISRKLALKN